MSNLPTNTQARDELDRLFSDFFKTQFPQPWPQAPIPVDRATEPSELTSRSSEVPREQPGVPARRDSTTRARFTLVASVALALGASLLLSNGFNPGETSSFVPAPSGGTKVLPDSGADATKDPRIKKLEEDKMKDNNGMKFDPSKL